MAVLTVGPGKMYTTIEAAIAASSSGDTIDIYNGTYEIPASVTITPKNNQIVGAATGQTAVIIDGALCNRSSFPVVAMSATGAILRDVIVRNAKTAAKAAITLGGSGNSIDHCNVIENEECGIFGFEATGGTIKNCYVYHCATVSNSLMHGIYLSDCSNVTVEDCWIRGNSNPGGGQGLHINGGAAAVTGMIVRRNIFDRNGASATRQGMDFMNTHDSWCYNNIFIDNGIKCLSNVPPYAQAYSDDNVISNNTFVAEHKATVIELLGPVNGDYDGARRCVIFNNLIFTTSTSLAIKDNQTDPSSPNYVDTASNIRIVYGTAALLEYFVDAAGGDYRLKSTSPARDAGLATYHSINAPTTDKDGNARPQ